MVRIQMRGGVWKNTEDEILKAAVMKYGKHNWARVASLLPRKSAKQVKARWYEWLDPSIKKTEWSREEDEKLLHLAKLMPNQWRTIAPLVGRTARMCLDRYERLLDAAQDEGQPGDDLEDARRLRPGEIDPAPETKPARPDPIDMDEDEKEMLSEARARLANTKGKKAKRKAREKQLEEARRLAALQKRRELKAAGIVQTRRARRRQHLDYEHEIPFYQAVPAGFFSTAEEDARTQQLSLEASAKSFKRLRTDQMEAEDRRQKRKKQEKNDERAMRKIAKADPVGYSEKVARANDPTVARARSALALPAPQVSDAELEDIVRLGQLAQSAAAEAGSQSATQALLGDYAASITTPTPMRTPRQVGAQDSLVQEARLQRALIAQQTPLLGSVAPADDGGTPAPEAMEVDLSSGTGFQGVTPMRNTAATPRADGVGGAGATPLRGGPGSTPGGSVRGGSGATPRATPLRDALGLNADGMPEPEAPRRKKDKSKAKGRHGGVAAALGNLPAPENEVSLELPALPEEDGEATMVEDAEERDARRAAEKRREVEKELARRSSVVQRSLPRPAAVEAKGLLKAWDAEDEVEALVREEMVGLLARDARDHPVSTKDAHRGLGLSLSATAEEGEKGKKKGKGKKAKRGDLATQAEVVEYVEVDDAELENARDLVHRALRELPQPNARRFREAWERQHKALIETREGYRERDGLNEGELLHLLALQHDTATALLGKLVTKADRVQAKLGVHLGGYMTKATAHAAEFQELSAQLDATTIELHSCRTLAAQEARALPQRLADATAATATVQEREMDLQRAYAALEGYRGKLFAAIEGAGDTKATA